MFKKLGLALIAVLATGFPALAAPVATGSLEGPLGDAAFGSTVTFVETWENVPGWAWPMMTVGCFQDVDADGDINVQAGWTEDGVYMELVGPGSTASKSGTQEISVVLGGGASDWHRSPGPALCSAQAYYYGWKGSRQYIVSLGDTVFFSATDSRTPSAEVSVTESVVSAARMGTSTIYVSDAVWGGTTLAEVYASAPAKNATVNYVWAQCWSSVDGEYLFSAFYDIVDNQSVLGPFATGSTWTQPEPANCTAKVGYFTRQGFGKWVETGSTSFLVNV